MNIVSRNRCVALEVRGCTNHGVVCNKIDTTTVSAAKQKLGGFAHIVFIAARENLYTDELLQQMKSAVLKGTIQTGHTIVTNARHSHALKEAEKSLVEIKAGLDNKLPGDLLALDIRRCLHYLGEITGGGE